MEKKLFLFIFIFLINIKSQYFVNYNNGIENYEKKKPDFIEQFIKNEIDSGNKNFKNAAMNKDNIKKKDFYTQTDSIPKQADSIPKQANLVVTKTEDDYTGLYLGAATGLLVSRLKINKNRGPAINYLNDMNIIEKAVFNPLSSITNHILGNLFNGNNTYIELINTIAKIERYALAGHFIHAARGNNFKEDALKLYKKGFSFLKEKIKENSSEKNIATAAIIAFLYASDFMGSNNNPFRNNILAFLHN